MIYHSPFPSLDAEFAALPDLVRGAAARAPDRPALIDAASGAAVSYATLAARIGRIAAGLAERGFAPGDVLTAGVPSRGRRRGGHSPPRRAGREVPVAVVVPRGTLSPGGLIAWVAGRVAPHKRIRAVRLASQIPRTPSGKILRRLLIEEDQGAAGRPAAPALGG